ncbi:MAG: type II toxin-antitoxin system HicA family toxin [Bacteroidetes bacterium]|nr:type II toxin-antitoxin system HicA family toxin [Bacteroidota bacterium]MBU1423841.1 type II toxin-antitoxin system HicA family toxin [Bacteroidota bacterium]MBU2471115.1 type II toxin-antitoxin system HicA family toxin [Bacteroidota bacterium]MBU2637295.1 type II toxin-antitoxin system HicA family toxin [Bacteroidota bacterium]
MGNIRPLKPKELARAIEKLGFRLIRQKGSHAVYRHDEGRWVTIPMHSGKDLSKGFIYKILKDAKLNWEDVEKVL